MFRHESWQWWNVRSVVADKKFVVELWPIELLEGLSNRPYIVSVHDSQGLYRIKSVAPTVMNRQFWLFLTERASELSGSEPFGHAIHTSLGLK
jgi:hypothetical protein